MKELSSLRIKKMKLCVAVKILKGFTFSTRPRPPMLSVNELGRFYYLRNFHDMRCKYGRILSVMSRLKTESENPFVTPCSRNKSLIFHQGKTADTYNIGGFNEWKNIDIIKVVIKTVDRLLGRKEDIEKTVRWYLDNQAWMDKDR